jgi:hypothetical protein
MLICAGGRRLRKPARTASSDQAAAVVNVSTIGPSNRNEKVTRSSEIRLMAGNGHHPTCLRPAERIKE